ncbi:MAG: VanZ family protein [Burkholderiaceae bacterium]|nr:VanZ family protein [Burkholderiales bacterium]MCZ8105229.1 VanZ family protein [Burkholderiales bacterium]MCZ8337398.1 VanZ family protein [Burkholderiaceae bacterium]
MTALDALVHPPRWLRAFALLAFLAVAANLFWHGAQPYAVGAVPAPWDKLAHLLLYGGFSAAAWVALGGARPTADLLAPIVAVSVGLLDEYAQALNPGREVGIYDLFADAVGAVAAVLVLTALRGLVRRRADARRATPRQQGSDRSSPAL